MKKKSESKRKVAFSKPLTDYKSERNLIKKISGALGRPLNILVIGTESADLPLLMAMSEIEKINVVDKNINQLFLLKAKITSLFEMEFQDIAKVFGYGECTQEERISTFTDKVIPHLDKKTAEYFSDNKDIAMLGLEHCGGYEKLISELIINMGDDNPYFFMTESWEDAFNSAFSEKNIALFFPLGYFDYKMRVSLPYYMMEQVKKEIRISMLLDRSKINERPRNRGANNYLLRDFFSNPMYGSSVFNSSERICLAKNELLKIGKSKISSKLNLTKAKIEIFMDEKLNPEYAGDKWDLIIDSGSFCSLEKQEGQSILGKLKGRMHSDGVVITRNINGKYSAEDIASGILSSSKNINSAVRNSDLSFMPNELLLLFNEHKVLDYENSIII